MKQENQIKCVKYGTPEGNIWIASNGVKFIAAYEKETAKELLTKSETKYDQFKVSIVSKYTIICKSPMLIVGSNNWLRRKIPFYLLQENDVYMFFYPNSGPAWVCGFLAVNRTKENASPIWSFGSHFGISKALSQGILELVAKFQTESGETNRNRWLMNWIYRCPKIGLQDVLHLESYKESDMINFEVDTNNRIQNVFRIIKGGK